MPKGTERLHQAMEQVRKAGTDQKKLDPALHELEAVANEVLMEAETNKKMGSEKPEDQEAEAVSTSNIIGSWDSEYDAERRMNAPYSAGERAALEDPAYHGAAETDWLHPVMNWESPIDKALKAPNLTLNRARKI